MAVTVTIDQAIELAVAQQRAGNAAEARHIYDAVLRQQPFHADARRLAALIDVPQSLRHVRAIPAKGHDAVLRAVRHLLGARTYVEIGVQAGGTLGSGLAAELVVGIDPAFALKVPLAQTAKLFRQTSDAFFAGRDLRAELYGADVDVGFIDGMHLFEFALRDFINLERHAGRHSVVFFHDVFPAVAEEAVRDGAPVIAAGRPWRGDVYKIVFALRRFRPDLAVVPLHDPLGGLLAVSRLDPASRVLAQRYDDILATYAATAFEEVRLDLYDQFSATTDAPFLDLLGEALLARRPELDRAAARHLARQAVGP